MSTRKEQLASLNRLLDIMDELREECPWDKKQTIESLRQLTIEEVYELGDAITANDLIEIRKELGDLLLHIVFYAKIGSETNSFDITSIANGICDKLIVRHPHIYGDTIVNNEEQVKENWEKIKLKEKKGKSVLEGVPKSLPALVKAYRIQEKVSGVGFDWDNANDVWAKVQEELNEFNIEVKQQNQDNMEKEFGDVLFSMINYARFIGINPENALEKTNMKFINRFKFIEKQALLQNKKVYDLTLREMDKIWEESKKHFS